MDLHLELTEVEALRHLLYQQLSDLRVQIVDTDTSTFRDQLKREKAEIISLLEKLGADVSVLA